MNLQTFIFSLFVLVAMCACKKNNTDNKGTIKPDPIKTEKGMPIGAAVTKTIGSSGGELVSADGKLKVVVAAGTVAGFTEFSIQPITSTLFAKENRIAYRLLPEGQTFQKPVRLEFHYTPDDTLHTTEDVLTMAYQRSDGAWKVVPSTLDKTLKKLTVETTHFSDWTITGGVYLEADENLLGLGQKTKLRVISVARAQPLVNTDSDDDVIAPLVPLLLPEDRNKLESVDNWKIVNGIGGLTVESGQLGSIQHEAEYGAPSEMTPNRRTMLISVDVKGYNIIKDPSAPGGVRRLNKIILFERITVVKEYMRGTFDGQPFEFTGQEVGADFNPLGAMVFTGANNSQYGIVLSAKGQGAGEYSFDELSTSASLTFTNGSPGYGGSWAECSNLGIFHFSKEPIKVIRWGKVGEYTEGSYSGPVFLQDGNCGKREKHLFVEFNIVRDR